MRISGKDSLKIAGRIFISKDKKRLNQYRPYSMHYGWIAPVSSKNRQGEAEIIDEALLCVMRAPKSFTREDVVEINCHGGAVALRRVLELVLSCGVRLAGPGEFTKRAFLNGRIDLAQAEAVLDIIKAKTDSALKIGVEQLRGALSLNINSARKKLLDILTVLEANIDFPEDQVGAACLDGILIKLNGIDARFSDILSNSGAARKLREGIHVAICGRPNVGKSSLLNALLKQERSIVSPVAGTTRDTIEEIIDIRGIPVRIVDTAGVARPRGIIERKAVSRTKKILGSVDLAILMFDGSSPLTKEDDFLINKLKKITVLPVINKIDLRQRIDKAKIVKSFARQPVEISSKKFKNIGLLEDEVADFVYKGRLRAPESLMMANLRHIESLIKARSFIKQAIASIGQKSPVEFIAQDIKDALRYLDDILGKNFTAGLLDVIFSEFCIGK